MRSSPSLAREWAKREHLAKADGIGIVMGQSSGITEIDIDAPGEAYIAAAIERFGPTPVVIRTASGKSKLWYRHNGEGRLIRPTPEMPIDVLGDGCTLAPPSWNEVRASAYMFVNGSIPDIQHLPTIRTDDFAVLHAQSPSAVRCGERNDTLWRFCMGQARYCDDVEALIDAAESWAACFQDPLNKHEIQSCARSAWKYEESGRNFVGLKKPTVTAMDLAMDNLIDKPDAYTLYQLLCRWHPSRPIFAIAPTAMSNAGNPPWSPHRISHARDVLLERMFIEEVSPPERGRRRAGRYRLCKMQNSYNNNYTPSPQPGHE